nr:unnamed protein product [Callosobruchus analis]
MECALCNQVKQPTQDLKNPCFPYDSCKNLICVECSDLSPSEIRCIPLQKRLLIFHCKRCRNWELTDMLLGRIKDKEKIITELEEKTKLLYEKIDSLEKAKAVHMLMQRSVMFKQIDPSKLKVGIRSFVTNKKGVAFVKCQTEQETEVLKEEIKNKMGDNYKVELSKLRPPKIKIIDFNKELNEDQICSDLIEQNHLHVLFLITMGPTENSDKFRIGHINARSLLAGFNEFGLLVSENNFDVIAVSETWLMPEIVSDQVGMDGYRCFRCDRDGRGGGVAFFLSKISTVQLSCPYLAYLWLRIKMCNETAAMAVFYRPPQSSVAEAITEFDDMLSMISQEYDNIVLAGDIAGDIENCFKTYGLAQIVTEPTRVTETTATLIDPIFLSKPDICLKSGVINADLFSDHNCVFCDLIMYSKNNNQRYITIRNSKNLM